MPALVHAVARHPGSEKDYGPFLNVVTWVLLITSALAVLTRLVTKRALRRRIDVDDVFVIAALITSIASSVSVSIQVHHGLGRRISSLDEGQIVGYEKSQYANRLLYITTLTLAKLSIISLLMILTAADTHRKFCHCMVGLIAIWGIVSVFVAAFQCGIDEPWHFIHFIGSSPCTDMPSFWRVMGALNMLTDLALIFFPVHVILTLQMSLDKKLTIIVFFSARSLDIIATGIQLAYTPAFASDDPTRDLWKWTMNGQVIECIAILTSCIPYLRPLLEALPSGLYGADEIRRRGTPSDLSYLRSKSISYKISSQTTTADEIKDTGSRRSQDETGLRKYIPMLSGVSTSHSNSASGLPGGPRRTDGETGVQISGPSIWTDKEWETNSMDSQTKIVKTTTVSAAWEEVQRRSKESCVNEITISKSSR